MDPHMKEEVEVFDKMRRKTKLNGEQTERKKKRRKKENTSNKKEIMDDTYYVLTNTNDR